MQQAAELTVSVSTEAMPKFCLNIMPTEITKKKDLTKTKNTLKPLNSPVLGAESEAEFR